MKYFSRAFSLMEVAVSLTVLGLLVAGVFSGKHLITLAYYRNLIQDVGKYEEAVTQFKERFKYLPGDFPNATQYWSTATSNGDGDWLIEETAEALNSWQHLYLAELISMPMDGTASGKIIPGRNVPVAPFGNGKGVYHLHTHTTSVYGLTGHAIDVALIDTPDTNQRAHFGLFTAKDAYNIDFKIDDGLASTGYVFASWGDDVAVSSCVDAASSTASANYVRTNTTQSCRMHFWYDRRPNKE